MGRFKEFFLIKEAELEFGQELPERWYLQSVSSYYMNVLQSFNLTKEDLIKIGLFAIKSVLHLAPQIADEVKQAINTIEEWLNSSNSENINIMDPPIFNLYNEDNENERVEFFISRAVLNTIWGLQGLETSSINLVSEDISYCLVRVIEAANAVSTIESIRVQSRINSYIRILNRGNHQFNVEKYYDTKSLLKLQSLVKFLRNRNETMEERFGGIQELIDLLQEDFNITNFRLINRNYEDPNSIYHNELELQSLLDLIEKEFI